MDRRSIEHGGSQPWIDDVRTATDVPYLHHDARLHRDLRLHRDHELDLSAAPLC